MKAPFKKATFLNSLLLCIALIVTLSHPEAQAEERNTAGYKFVIYYGIPSGVNNLWNPQKAAETFSEYDYVVFGDKLELPEHHHHDSTKEVIENLTAIKPDIQVFGYIDLGVTTDNLPMAEIKRRAELWQSIGATGIFLDDAGYDYKVSRERLNEAVQSIHSLGMPAFINAWNPDDVMSSAVHPVYNSKGQKSKLGKEDYYLLEDFLQATDITNATDPSAFSRSFRSKIDKVIKYRKSLGVKLLSVSVIDYETYSTNAVRKFFRLNESTAAVFSLDGYGVSPKSYSASKTSQDVVRKFPYIQNYMDYYNPDVKYVAKFENRDYASDSFRVHSVPGKHFYNYPSDVIY